MKTNKINYSQGWSWAKDDYKVKSALRLYWYSIREPITAVLRYCKKRGIKLNRILESGCGGGFTGIGFIIHNSGPIYFVDASIEMLESCRYNIRKLAFFKKIKSTENRLICQDMLNLGFKDGQFDLVISSGVYEHLHEKRLRLEFLKESKRVLKKGGCLYVAIPNNKHPLTSYWKEKKYCWLDENNPFYEISLSVDEFKSEFEEAGFYDIYSDGSKLWDFIVHFPDETAFRRITAFLLKAFVPELTRNIRLKFATWLWAIGRGR